MERNVDVAKILIRFYNVQADCAISAASTKNQEIVFTCLNRVGNDAIAVKNHIRAWTQAHKSEGSMSTRFEECLEAIEVKAAPFAVAAAVATDNPLNTGLEIITKTVAELVAKTSADDIKTKIMDSVKHEAIDFITNTYGPIEKKITIDLNGAKRELKGVLHEKFEEVLKLVSMDIPVFLTGPAGSGKNVICKQVAEALGLKFYFSNAVTQEYKITGFTDAMGKYQPTQFYKAFTEGGVFMLDEMDASIPEVLNTLNAAIANRYFDFPAPIGFVNAHKDVHIVAAGNTTGHGADYDYVGRNQLDGASLDRFLPVPINYCAEIENQVAGDIALADFCREFRKAAKKVGVNIIVSYRAIDYLARTMKVLPIEEAFRGCLVKDLERDDLNMITNELRDTEYKRVLRRLCEQM